MEEVTETERDGRHLGSVYRAQITRRHLRPPSKPNNKRMREKNYYRLAPIEKNALS